jgi:uncharacterized protein (TIGR02145 family)
MMEGEEGEILIWSNGTWEPAAIGAPGFHLAIDSTLVPIWRESAGLEIQGLAGCRDSAACNFNFEANVSYPDLCDFETCAGCTNPNYAEFDSTATFDDGSCVTRWGCTDAEASNYDSEADIDNGSCRFFAIELLRWGNSEPTPFETFNFEARPQDSVGFYSNWSFYVDDELVQSGDSRFLSFTVDTAGIAIHATADFEGQTLSTDTIHLSIEANFVEIPVIIDLSLFPSNLPGDGVMFYSSLDSVYLTFEEIVQGIMPELLCDFSSGTDFITGEIFPNEQSMWYSFNHIEATDTLDVNLHNTICAICMSMPALASEETSILNFVDAFISSTSDYLALSENLTGQLGDQGYFTLGLPEFELAGNIASELKEMLPEVLEMPNAHCPQWFDGGLTKDWPILSPDPNDNSKLKYDDCGMDLSYAVRAKTNHLDGGSATNSKTFIFMPEYGIIGNAIMAEAVSSYDYSDAFEFRTGFFENKFLTKQELMGVKNDGNMAIVVSRNGENAFNGAMPVASPYSLLLDHSIHILDAILPFKSVCEEVGQILYELAQTISVILEYDIPVEDKAIDIVQAIVQNIYDQSGALILCAVPDASFRILWSGVVILSGGLVLVPSIVGNLASFYNDANQGLSYMTRQVVVDGKFYGTPLLRPNDEFLFEAAVNDGYVNGEEAQFPLMFTGNEYYFDGVTQNYQNHFGLNWRIRNTAINANEKKTFPSFEYDWVPFAAFDRSGGLIQLAPSTYNPAPEISRLRLGMGLLGESNQSDYAYSPGPGAHYVTGVNLNNLQLYNEIVGEHLWDLQNVSLVSDAVCSSNQSLQAFVPSSNEDEFAVKVGDATSKTAYQAGTVRTGVRGTIRLGHQPFVRPSETADWKPLPPIPNVFPMNQDGLNSPGFGFPVSEFRGVWGAHATMQGNLLLDGQGVSHPLHHEDMADTVLISPEGGEFNIELENQVDLPDNLILKISVNSGSIEADESCYWCLPGGVVETSAHSVSLKCLKYSASEQHSRVVYTPSEESNGYDTMTIELLTDCAERDKLAEWELTLDFHGCQNQFVKNYFGYSYDLVEIGDQCWFAENLRTTAYSNGYGLAANLSQEVWVSTHVGATAVYGEGLDSCTAGCGDLLTMQPHGRLYNWYAVNNPQGLCPSGWHVPTDGEWRQLEEHLGMSSSSAWSTGWRGNNQGSKLKSSSSDVPGWDGSNSSGFSGLPGGLRFPWESFYYNEGARGCFWTSTPSGYTNALNRVLISGLSSYSTNKIARVSENRHYGFSVRCLKD